MAAALLLDVGATAANATCALLEDDDYSVGCVICMCAFAKFAPHVAHPQQTPPGFNTHVQHKATLDVCAHSFCTKCIELWISHRHAAPWCPVCRQPITGYLTTSLQAPEHSSDAPAQPSPGPTCGPTSQQRGGSQTTQLRYSNTHQQHQPSQDLSDTATSVHSTPPTVRHVTVQPRQRSPSPPQGSNWLPRHRSHPSRPSRRQATVRPAHRHLCASAEASLRYRSSVYRHGLLAIPPGAPRDTGVPPLASLRDAPRIKTWITRDLQALLGDDDVALLADHVRGVFAEAVRRRGEGQVRPADAVEASCTTVCVQAVVDAWAHHQLRPYLGSRVAHFWHELRCFAGCPYTVNTYDRMVRYPAPPSRQRQ